MTASERAALEALAGSVEKCWLDHGWEEPGNECPHDTFQECLDAAMKGLRSLLSSPPPAPARADAADALGARESKDSDFASDSLTERQSPTTGSATVCTESVREAPVECSDGHDWRSGRLLPSSTPTRQDYDEEWCGRCGARFSEVEKWGR